MGPRFTGFYFLYCYFAHLRKMTQFSLLLGMRKTRSSGAACWGRCAMLLDPPVFLCASMLQRCLNCRQRQFFSFLHIPIINTFCHPLLLRRATPWPPNPLYSDFCASSWTLTFIFFWTKMIFISTIKHFLLDCAILIVNRSHNLEWFLFTV